MSRRVKVEEERSMDSLMDAMTNVVGILLLILIMSSLGITAAVRKVVENLPEVSAEQLAAMEISRKKTLENLQELKETFANTRANLPKPDEARQLVANLKEFEKDNKDLSAKNADIEEWRKKVDEEKVKKAKNEEIVLAKDKRNKELDAILDRTTEPVTYPAKEIRMPDPRLADPNSTVLYLVCKNQRLYFIGDPYSHVLKVRDVIDQNFTDLAFTGKAIGSYTYALKGAKKHQNGYFLPITERYRLTRGKEKELAFWNNVMTRFTNREGKTSDLPILKRIIGSDNKAELPVQKFRYDLKKIEKYFANGKFGPSDFQYFIGKGGGDRVKLSIAPREKGGWDNGTLGAVGSPFESICKTTSTNRRSIFYYYVDPESFETYLQARNISESFRIPAGWTIWEGQKLDLKAAPIRKTLRYNLSSLPAADYLKLAQSVTPFLTSALSKEIAEFDQRVTASLPPTITKPEEKNAFIEKLKPERREWIVTRLQPYTIEPLRAALAAQEASGVADVQIEINPPEIPQIRVFLPSTPPSKPTPPPNPKTRKPAKAAPPAGAGGLILD